MSLFAFSRTSWAAVILPFTMTAASSMTTFAEICAPSLATSITLPSSSNSGV